MDNTEISGYEQLVMANLLLAVSTGRTGLVKFQYKNWRNEIATRRVRLTNFRWGRTEWHPTDCLLLHAFDEDKNAFRTFAVADIAIGSIQAV